MIQAILGVMSFTLINSRSRSEIVVHVFFTLFHVFFTLSCLTKWLLNWPSQNVLAEFSTDPSTNMELLWNRCFIMLTDQILVSKDQQCSKHPE